MTVKVINSGEDNEPGKVRILNRQPEIGVELVAELTDPDKPITNVKWQWYRAVEGCIHRHRRRPRRNHVRIGIPSQRHHLRLRRVPVFP